MLVLFSLLTILLTFVTIVMPMRVAKQKAYRRAFWESVRVEQARVVRRHYPAAQKYTIAELREEFDISTAYSRIIRR